MPKESADYKEGVAMYKQWIKHNVKLEKMGLHGTDYYVRRVAELEAKVKKLEAKLKKKGK
jgi:hypothetical protein